MAMRDLEVRGAGNILGGEQHGHMEAVGYDMYVKLLNEAVSLMKGEEPTRPVDQECLVDLQVQAHIPESYIDSLSLRLDVYRRIAEVETQEDAMDVLDELIDRFGEPPASVKGLLDVALLRNTAAGLGVTEVKQQGDSLLVYKEKFDVAEVGPLIKALGGRVLLSAGSKPYISVKMAGQPPTQALSEILTAMQENAAPKP